MVFSFCLFHSFSFFLTIYEYNKANRIDSQYISLTSLLYDRCSIHWEDFVLIAICIEIDGWFGFFV